MSSTAGISAGSGASQMQMIQNMMKMRGAHQSAGTESAENTNPFSKADQTQFLNKFTKDFGSDAAKSITNEDGSVNFDKMKSFFDQKLSSSGKSGGVGGGDDQGGFNPMMAMMMGGMMGGGSGLQGMGSGQPPKAMQDKILSGISDTFGSDTAKSLTNSDGTINKDKFESFAKDHKDYMQEQMAKMMGEMGGLQETSGSSRSSSFDPLKTLIDALDKGSESNSKNTKHSHKIDKDESSKILDQFTKDFGSDAAKSITNEDGTVNGDKLMRFMQDKISGLNGNDGAGGTDFSSLLQQTYNSVSSSNDNQNVFDILFGDNKGGTKKTGHLVNASA